MPGEEVTDAIELLEEMAGDVSLVAQTLAPPAWSNERKPSHPGWWFVRNLTLNLQRAVKEVVIFEGRLQLIYGPNTRLYLDDIDPSYEFSGEIVWWPED